MMTLFETGQLVRATMSVQRLVKGVVYEVVAVDSNPTAFGTFVTYTVTPCPARPDGQRIQIVNGHLLLTSDLDNTK